MVAVPMYIFMGNMLERSGIVKHLLELLQYLLQNVRGGMAYMVVLMGTILAATTGIVGASVVMTAVLALPMMMQLNYSRSITAGTIAASGTLGIIIPPSIMLIIMADMLSISVSDLFLGAVIPGLILPLCYLFFLWVYFRVRPESVPQSTKTKDKLPILTLARLVLLGIVPPTLLIAAVLGSIFLGYATPTEASGVGAVGAILLVALNRRLTRRTLTEAMYESAVTVGMIFMIFAGATIFAYVFRLLGGEHAIITLIEALNLDAWGLLIILLVT